MTRYRATLAYDGAAYQGFQRQAAGTPTIQACLEQALAVLAEGKTVRVIGAGRTDTGVHASGQVIAFDLDWHHGVQALRSALNANLPPDVAIVAVQETHDGFHPRYDAVSRTYAYRITVAAVRDPLRRLRAWHQPGPLVVDAMQHAAHTLLGTHDFSAFGTPPKGDNSVRTVYSAHWDVAEGGLRFTIQADAFLYRMVRRIVGTLVLVGQGRMTVEEFRQILASRDPARAAAPAPPQGLVLVAVHYEDDDPESRLER